MSKILFAPTSRYERNKPFYDDEDDEDEYYSEEDYSEKDFIEEDLYDMYMQIVDDLPI